MNSGPPVQYFAIGAALLGAQLLAASASGAPPAAATGAELMKQVGITPRLGERLPLDLKFVDSTGKQVRLGDGFAGRPVILHLVYYECPMLCRLSADGLLSSLSTLTLELGDDFSIVTLSFDPREGPELSARARELAVARCGKEPVERGWRFLTGDESAIEAVTKAVGFRYAWDEKSGQFAHASGIFVLTPGGEVSRYLGGIEYSPRDLRFALVEASGNKIGTWTDQVLMLCYMYDPAVGKYGLAIMTVIRLGGLATVGCLAASICTMIRRDRRHKRQALAATPPVQQLRTAP